MPQALSAVYIHLVFSTKDRRPYLRDPAIREQLHSYLGRTSKELECAPLIVGGIEDHVHMLARLGRTITQADWVKELKRISSIWMKDRIEDFAWQSGYACFSVSKSNLEPVQNYILHQEKHHEQSSFQDELRALLKKHDIEYDEAYLWD